MSARTKKGPPHGAAKPPIENGVKIVETLGGEKGVPTEHTPAVKRGPLTARIPAENGVANSDIPCAIPRMPSILEMGKLIRALDDANTRADEEESKLTNNAANSDRRHVLGHIKQMTFEQGDALTALLTTIPAASLGDAAVHIVLAKSIAEDLENNDYEDADKYSKLRQLNRLLASVMPLVAEAAGVTVLEIGGEWLAGSRERHFPELGGGL